MQISSLIAVLAMTAGANAKNASSTLVQTTTSTTFRHLPPTAQCYAPYKEGVGFPILNMVEETGERNAQNQIIEGTRKCQNGMQQNGRFNTQDELIFGTQLFPSGTVTQGSYLNGYLDGPDCQIIYPDNVIQKGTCKEGWLVEGKTVFPDWHQGDGDFVESGVRLVQEFEY